MNQKNYWITGAIGFLFVVVILMFSAKNSNQERTVDWDEAIKILNSGQTQGVMQTHSLDISLTLKDGTIIHTKEPKIDDIFDEIKKCGYTRKYIISATE